MNGKSGRGPRVLYIVYWGAMEPLGQSLVLPAVRRLAAQGARLTLVTFEKPEDAARTDEIAQARRSLEESGIEWIPLLYHKRPRIPATAFDVFNGLARAVASRLRFRPDIIHARTFVGGLIGLTLAPLIGARFIYHNEGFYPDEQVDAGVWQKDSAPHRVACWLERRMYASADGIIALSHKAKSAIERFEKVQRRKTPVIVVPSCVDLDHFSFSHDRPSVEAGPVKLVYAGSIGGRYLFDRIGHFAEVASREAEQAHLRVLTRSEPSVATLMLAGSGLADWSIKSVPYSEMPKEIASQQAGLHFLPQGISEHGGSPTKIGEYWASGLAAVVTPNAGDTDDIIRRERVGVIVSNHTENEYRRAFRELLDLLSDPDLPARCRRAAESHYALTPACERQIYLYNEVVNYRYLKGRVNEVCRKARRSL